MRLVALLVGIGLAVVTTGLGADGRGLMLAAAVLGLCVLVGTAVGETVVRPRRDPGPRSASLAPRRVRDYLPRTTPLVVALTVALVGTLVLTTLTADPDDTGRARALSCTGPAMGQSHGPYAGSFYSLPLAVMLVLVLATAVVAARQVVARPRGMAATDEGDDRLRRNSLDVIVAATGVAVAAPLAGVALTTGSALRSMTTAVPTCAPGWWSPVGVAFLLLALVALASASLLLGRLVLVPSPPS